MMSRQQAITQILRDYDDGETLFVITDGILSREFYARKKDHIFCMTGSMGLVPAIALGVALNTKKRVVAVSGDGSFLMSLGTQALLNHYNLPNLIHIIIDNGSYETTGGQRAVEIPYMDGVIVFKVKKGGEKPARIQSLKMMVERFRADVER